MFKVKNPTKNIKDICTALGIPYEIKVIDGENVIYRNLGNGFDFEVSKLDNNKKIIDATLYIWNIQDKRIVETINGIKSLDNLKNTLNSSVEKYLKLTPSDFDSI